MKLSVLLPILLISLFSGTVLAGKKDHPKMEEVDRCALMRCASPFHCKNGKCISS